MKATTLIARMTFHETDAPAAGRFSVNLNESGVLQVSKTDADGKAVPLDLLPTNTDATLFIGFTKENIYWLYRITGVAVQQDHYRVSVEEIASQNGYPDVSETVLVFAAVQFPT